ncbi:pyruvate dehydrogenase (quinone) [Quadrisphaera granulorum]|uniref:Pyruvate dehydrogenase (Quinone) n=1 Tax=Quadrisphaera granulorum TaxID=317664 RepID=A0A316AC98_9ACTN|nr:thiamine pyrophosphate-requiring protein [Quadrisphaera granulorum]PWJ55212.1 pyruvate dehydrogenase (quinone) [Quadrisphaera granulorum]SZE95721.1 pyruvate dehydrogenase (quinone) [Quadrisphaera granulorum]
MTQTRPQQSTGQWTDVPEPTTVGDHVVERLARWGVRRYYGYPGDGIGGVMAGISRARRAGAAQLVQVRHEETAAFAAVADVKYGGSPIGACVVTSGPGAIHALNGLYDATLDRVPVVALVGQSATPALGTSFYQEIDAKALYEDVADYVIQLSSPDQVIHAVDRACRTALAHRTVCAIIVPSDLGSADAALSTPNAHGYSHTSSVPSTDPGAPPQAALREAAAVLNAGERVAILAGVGAAGATQELTAVADALGAGAAKALLGKHVLDDRLPWVTGAIGLLGTRASYELMQHCDTLLVVGSTMPYGEYYPPPGQARSVQIDLDGAKCGLRTPTEVNLVGDAAETLAALLPLLRRNPEETWRQRIATWKDDDDAVREARCAAAADPVNPEAVVRGLQPHLPENALLAVDCGTATAWYARDVDLTPQQFGSLSGLLLSMGGALPYALAAKTAHPHRPVIALVGDGAMQMNGVNELITVAREWQTWEDPRLAILVLNNRDLSFETWEVRAELGEVPDPASQSLPDVPYAQWAQLLGLAGTRVEHPEDVDAAWAAALAADQPFVIDAVVDPATPIIPPHVSTEQALQTVKSGVRSAMHGDEEVPGLVRQGLRQVVAPVLSAVRHRPRG